MNPDSARIVARLELDRVNRIARAAGEPCTHPNVNSPAALISRTDGKEAWSWCRDCRTWTKRTLGEDVYPASVPPISLNDLEIEDAA